MKFFKIYFDLDDAEFYSTRIWGNVNCLPSRTGVNEIRKEEESMEADFKSYLEELMERDIAFLGSDWVPDEDAKHSPFPGYRYNGEINCIICSDVFFWGSADSETITEETFPDFLKAVDDCKGSKEIGAWLYCARIRKERPQGAAYTFIAKDLWPLFDACGPEREVEFGNPYKPGGYNPNRMVPLGENGSK